MSTIDSVLTVLQTAIDMANATTGGRNVTVTDAVSSLIAGYGSGGESGDGKSSAYIGEITPTERLASFTFDCIGVRNFAIMTFSEPDLTTGCAFLTVLVADKDSGIVRTLGSVNAGTSMMTGNNYTSAPTNYPAVTFNTTNVTLSVPNLTDTCRTLQPNLNYKWVAW